MNYLFPAAKKEEEEYFEKVLNIKHNKVFRFNIQKPGYLVSLEMLNGQNDFESIYFKYDNAEFNLRNGFMNVINKLTNKKSNNIPIEPLFLGHIENAHISLQHRTDDEFVFKVLAKFKRSNKLDSERFCKSKYWYQTFEKTTRNDSLEIDISGGNYGCIIQTNNKLTNVQFYNDYLDSVDVMQIENPEQIMEGYYYIKFDTSKIFNKLMLYRKDDEYCGKIEGTICYMDNAPLLLTDKKTDIK